MPSPKAMLRSLSPPILWELGHKLKSYVDQSRPLPAKEFEGPIPSWEAALARSDGWDEPSITIKTLESALKVRDGLAEFEQDGLAYEQILYSPAVLAFIILALSRCAGQLSILEVGGGLGQGYYQNRKILQNLCKVRIAWSIVERPDLAKLGTEYFAKSDLRFFSSLESALDELENAPEFVLFSGSLQYLTNPFDILDQITEIGTTVLAFDRLLVSPTDKHAIFIQHPPKILYHATYPAWCFSKDLFIDKIVSRGFALVEHFTSSPKAEFDHCGMIFVRRL
jgi:putative methyltransferase (TIGR04325 family)